MYSIMSDYSAGVDVAKRHIDSSLRDRPQGFDGLLSDLAVVESLLSAEGSRETSTPEYLSGIRAVLRDCHLAIRAYKR